MDIMHLTHIHTWIGKQKSLFEWPSYSPDMVPDDFFLYRRFKAIVFKTLIEEFKQRIMEDCNNTASVTIKAITNKFLREPSSGRQPVRRSFMLSLDTLSKIHFFIKIKLQF